MTTSNASIASIPSWNERGGYSARVRLFLLRGGSQLPLAQVGPDQLYLDAPGILPPGPADLIIEIDGEADCTPIEIAEQTTPARIVAYTRR